LTVRLQRGAVLGWSAGTAFLALVYGGLTSAIEDFVRDNPDLAEFLQTAGGDLTDAYFATAARTLALIGSGFAIQSSLRLRSEETAMRSEPVLATATSRSAYWSAHAVVAMAGTAIVLTAAGLVLGVSGAIAVGDPALVVRGTGATLAHLPAALLLVAVAIALVGVAPRWTAVAWALLVTSFVVAMFGPILDLPAWAMRLSPFELLERVPAERLTPWPIGGLTAASIVLAVVGLAGYRRRDIPTT
jgi:ABC-2 type transport system permease protein